MLFDFVEFLAEPLTEDLRYVDPDLAPAHETGEIDAAALARVRAALPASIKFSGRAQRDDHSPSPAKRAKARNGGGLDAIDDAMLAHWFGCFITRYRSAQIVAAARRRGSELADLQRRLPGSSLMRNPFSRYAWHRTGRSAELFVAGEAWPCPATFARLVCTSRDVDGAALARTCTDTRAWTTLAALLDGGHLQFLRRRAR